MKTSVVILNWNGKKHLETFLPSVVKYSHNCEIVVADNGSSDDSVSFIKEVFPTVRIILLDKNYGFTGGYNRAIEQIDSLYTVLLNSDVEVTEGWLENLVGIMDSDQNIAAAQPKILSYINRNMFEHAGACGGFIDILGYPYCRGRIVDNVEEDRGQYNDTCNIFWATGAAMIIRTELYKKHGGLDEDFFAHMEEIDLCWRLKSFGYRIVVNPSSVVYHLGGGTLAMNSPRKVFLNFRNNLFMLYKNLPTGYLVPIMFARMLLDGVAAISFLLKGQIKMSDAVFNAHIDFYRNVGKMRPKRKQNRLVIPNEVYRGSIILKNIFK